MEDSERGKIRNRDFVPEKDFSGLRYGKITPTDLDGFVEFDDQVFVFIELKYRDSEMKKGQRVALERLCDVCWRDGKYTVLIVARYEEGGKVVDVAPLPVVQYRFQGQWEYPKRPLTVRQLVDAARTHLKTKIIAA